MRLLLAEDEQALSKALTAILERNNYSVDAVFDGQTALEYLESDNYDGVISGYHDAQKRRHHGTPRAAQPGKPGSCAASYRQIRN